MEPTMLQGMLHQRNRDGLLSGREEYKGGVKKKHHKEIAFIV